MAKSTKFLTLTLDFGSKLVYDDDYDDDGNVSTYKILGSLEILAIKNSSGNIPSKFPHDLFLSLGIEKYQNLCWRSFFRDGSWLNLLC